MAVSLHSGSGALYMTKKPIPTGNAGDAPSESCISYTWALLLVGTKDASKMRLQLLVSAMCAYSELLHPIVL